ncbi:hypothetical protein A3860_35265 [Niastella vici]|uniref:Uncharacterized protein n=1 Tax=Niastella vici TaxID=1703345 RepID=A0A1V9FNW9_9BACT|nr:hypothetical protein A3860_35265 [Niastella vici]
MPGTGYQDLSFDYSANNLVLKFFCLAPGNRQPVTEKKADRSLQNDPHYINDITVNTTTAP